MYACEPVCWRSPRGRVVPSAQREEGQPLIVVRGIAATQYGYRGPFMDQRLSRAGTAEQHESFDLGVAVISNKRGPEVYELILAARAVVMPSGGLLCHAAIIARELGRPCIVGAALPPPAELAETSIIDFHPDLNLVVFE